MNFVNILLVIVTGYWCLLGYTFTRRRNTATLLLQCLMLVAVAWTLTYYLELKLPTLGAKIAAHLARFLFVPWVLVLLLALLRQLLGIGSNLPRGLWVTIIAVPVVTMLLAATAPWHRLFQYDFVVHPLGLEGELGILRYQRGPWCQFYELFTMAGMCPLIFGLMLRAWRDASPIMRRQLLTQAIQLSLPIGATVLYLLGHSPVPHVNLAPFLMAVSMAVLAWEVLVYRTLDIVPVARGVLLDTMPDLVFVFDAGGRLVDLNLASMTAIGHGLMDCVGKSAAELPPPWCAALQGDAPSVEIEANGNRRWFERTIRHLAGHDGTLRGNLMILRDVTDELARQHRELAYQKLLEERRHLRQQELLIRDLHDGVGGIVAAIGMLSALGLKEPDLLKKEEMLRQIMALAGEGNVEVRTLMGTLESREFFWADLITEMRRHGGMLETNHGIAFSLKIRGEGDAGGPGLFAGMALFRIFKESLNNVIKHAFASRVDVAMVFEDGSMVLTISDNGRGFAGEPPSGRGLRHMRQRISELGGTLQLENSGGLCLKFSAAIPLKSPDQGMDAPPSLEAFSTP
ncbi:MAG: PAS domain-containing protein [Verrucomicrobia bacterium]|nr:PAS domain-containing protein [Verrucomicrobiota bacterium]